MHDKGLPRATAAAKLSSCLTSFSLPKSCWPSFETRPTAKIVYEWVVCRIKTSPGFVGMRLAIDGAPGGHPRLAYREARRHAIVRSHIRPTPSAGRDFVDL